MRVLYIDHTAKIGGGEMALLNLVRYVDPGQVKPIVLLFEEGPLADRLRLAGVETHVLPLDAAVAHASKGSLGFGSLRQVKALWLTMRHVTRVAKAARQLQADILHTNSLKADIIGGLAGRMARIPVIWHVRDRISPDYLPAAVVRVFRLLCRTIPQFVIANSRATLDTIHLEGRRPSAAIGSGVDLGTRYEELVRQPASGATVRPFPLDSARPRIGLVGRISPWKGQDIFLRAAAQILKTYPGARFELIGAALFAEREFEDSLHQLCRTLGIEKSVEFVGFVDDVPARLEQLDLFVHASTTGEPFGQVIVEAMAAAKPVVATNGGGVPEIVIDKVTGLLVPMGDAVAMAEAVEFLLANPEQAQEMGRVGRGRVLDEFTIQKSAKMVEDVYKRLLRR